MSDNGYFSYQPHAPTLMNYPLYPGSVMVAVLRGFLELSGWSPSGVPRGATIDAGAT
jgi:hypothetical protein